VSNSFSIILLTIFLILSFLLVRSYLTGILTAAIFAYVCFPIHHSLSKKIKPGLSAGIIVIAALIIIIGPLAFALNQAAAEAISFFSQPALCEGCNQGVTDMFARFGLQGHLQTITQRATQAIGELTRSFVLSLPSRFLEFGLFVFLFFYFLRDGPRLLEHTFKLAPFSNKQRILARKEMSSIMYAVVYGNVLVSFIQGLLTMFFFWIFGVKAFFLWGMIAIIAAFIPYVGTPIIWAPISVIMIAQGITTTQPSLWGRGIGLLVVGITLLSTIDNVLKPFIIGNRASLHPAIVLVGVLGGLKVFGAIGIFLGPIIFALLRTSIRMVRPVQQ